MVSENILVREGRQYAFFHETFFDYAYACRFHAEERDLLEFLRDDEQHLFRRSQIRQILVYERNRSNKGSYLKDLSAVINDAGVRFHLKRVIFDILKSLKDPMEEEWEVLENYCLRKLSGMEHVFHVLRGSVPWFELLDKLAIISSWLASSDDRVANLGVYLLSGVQKYFPTRVAELLSSYIGISKEWDQRLMYIVQYADMGAGRDFLDLSLQLLDRGLFDDFKRPRGVNSDFWSFFYGLPEQHPEWACELMNHYLNRRLNLSLEAGKNNPFVTHIPHSQFLAEFALTCAKLASVSFVDNLLPFVIKVVELTAIKEGRPPWPDPIFYLRDVSGHHSPDAPLLEPMERALSDLASHYPERFAVIAEILKESCFDTVQFLLVRSYAANGPRFADEACDYLCEETFRLRTGYVGEPQWATRQLLEAITPYCSRDRIERLETTILNYYPQFEKTARGKGQHGHAQFVLLKGIEASRLSPAVQKRLQELRRKFGPVRRRP